MAEELRHEIRSVPETERNGKRDSVLDVEVSCFANYTTPSAPVSVNLMTWLTSGKYREEVERIRAAGDKGERDRLKGRLPAITPSGIFSARSEKGLIQHSGLMQFDIDLKENRRVGNFYELKRQIGNIPNVAYCGLSVSGQGFWGLLPIAHPGRHREHFGALSRAFLRLGVTLDEKPKNVSSLRGYSYDEEPYFNHRAAVFTRYNMPERGKPALRPGVNTTGVKGPSTRDRVEACIAALERTGADVTASYAAWFEIGCSLASEFGEEGRCYFHQISQYHPKYSLLKTNRQFNLCLKGGYRYTIATFFKHSQDASI